MQSDHLFLEILGFLKETIYNNSKFFILIPLLDFRHAGNSYTSTLYKLKLYLCKGWRAHKYSIGFTVNRNNRNQPVSILFVVFKP